MFLGKMMSTEEIRSEGANKAEERRINHPAPVDPLCPPDYLTAAATNIEALKGHVYHAVELRCAAFYQEIWGGG